MSAWANGAWNFVFVGCKGAPNSYCSTSGHNDHLPATTIPETPHIVEKPYIIMEVDGSFKLMKPKLEINKVGTTPDW